jgi:hypothetical protein
MTTDPATHFKAANTSLIRLAVEAMASAPYLTAAEKQMRSEAVICGIMAFLPSEPVQTMLASQAVGQHLLALDTFREAFNRSLTENASVRMRTAAAMCTRSTLSLMREIRVVRLGHHAAVVADKVAREEHEARLAQAAAPETVEDELELVEDVPELVEVAPEPIETVAVAAETQAPVPEPAATEPDSTAEDQGETAAPASRPEGGSSGTPPVRTVPAAPGRAAHHLAPLVAALARERGRPAGDNPGANAGLLAQPPNDGD